jgi:hypothetical protein
MIDDIVTVLASGNGFQIRRSVNVADPQRFPVGNLFGGRLEFELAVKLNAIGGSRPSLVFQPLLDHANQSIDELRLRCTA